MKKLLTVLAIALMLCGCGTATTQVSEGSETIITSEKTAFTKQDLFEGMKNNDYTSVILESLVSKIVTFEGITDENLNKRVESALDGFKAVYGDQYPIVVAYYGGEEALKASLAAEAQNQELINKYFEANREALLAEYKPVLGYAFYTEDGQVATAIMAEIANGKDLETAAKDAGYANPVSKSVITDKSDIALDVKEYINGTPVLGETKLIETEVTTSTANGSVSTPRYYIVQVVDNNVDNFKDDFVAVLTQSIDGTKIYSYFFEKYGLEVYDQDTYALLSSKFTGVK